MTALQRFRRCDLQLRIVRARLLLQISGEDRDVRLPDVLEFAQQIGVDVAVDSTSAFRSAVQAHMQAARAELAGLVN